MARKHIQQMNQQEKAFVHGYIRAQAALAFESPSKHYYDRASERSFTLEQAVEALRNGLVVEVHNDRPPAVRALVRDQKGTCVVIQLQDMQVITVYYNDPQDKHETLNWAPYRWSVDLVSVIKSLRTAA